MHALKILIHLTWKESKWTMIKKKKIIDPKRGCDKSYQARKIQMLKQHPGEQTSCILKSQNIKNDRNLCIITCKQGLTAMGQSIIYGLCIFNQSEMPHKQPHCKTYIKNIVRKTPNKPEIIGMSPFTYSINKSINSGKLPN